MTHPEFLAKWQQAELTERSAYQQHFLDLCEVLGQPKPAEADPHGAWYTSERGVRKPTREKGWADGIRIRSVPAPEAAHFLMKLLFCMFGEDIGLLDEKVFGRGLNPKK